MLWPLFKSFLASGHFLKKKSLTNTIRVSNSLDPDPDGPDLGPNCLQRLSADDKSGKKQGMS